jgi:hypothetical protein
MFGRSAIITGDAPQALNAGVAYDSRVRFAPSRAQIRTAPAATARIVSWCHTPWTMVESAIWLQTQNAKADIAASRIAFDWSSFRVNTATPEQSAWDHTRFVGNRHSVAKRKPRGLSACRQSHGGKAQVFRPRRHDSSILWRARLDWL